MEGLGGGEAQGVLDPPPKKKKNFTPKCEILPPGVKFAASGEICPLELKLSPRGVNPLFVSSFFLKRRTCSPLGVNKGVNIPLGIKVHPWGPRSSLVGKFTPWGSNSCC
jgi:hypothetical protein